MKTSALGFGCPKILINNRSTHFLDDSVQEIIELFQINHLKTTSYHPQTNGMVERVNQTLIAILCKTVVDSKRDWDIKLTVALWTYQTSYKVITWATPFALMHGIEAILPIQFKVMLLCIAINEQLDTSQSLNDPLARLEAHSEARQVAFQHVEVIQRHCKVNFNKSNKAHAFSHACGSWCKMLGGWSSPPSLMYYELGPTSSKRYFPIIQCN